MTYAGAAIFHRGNAITIMRERSNFNRAIMRRFIRLFLPADTILHVSRRYLFSASRLQRFVRSAPPKNQISGTEKALALRINSDKRRYQICLPLRYSITIKNAC